MSNPKAPSFDLLMEKYLDHSITDEERDRLKTMLKDDPALHREYVELLAQEVAIRDIAAEEAHRAATVSNSSRRQPRRKAPRISWAWWAAAAAVIVLAFMFSMQPPPGPDAPPMATLSNVSGTVTVQREGRTQSALPNDPIYEADTVNVAAAGQVRIEYTGGAFCELKGPSQAGKLSVAVHDRKVPVLELTTGDDATATVGYGGEQTTITVQPESTAVFGIEKRTKQIRLDKGKLEARIEEQAAGDSFALYTAKAETSLYGGHFGLSVSDEGTRLSVVDGQAVLTQLSDGDSIMIPAMSFAIAGGADLEMELHALGIMPFTTAGGDQPEPLEQYITIFSDEFEDNSLSAAAWEQRRENGPTALALSDGRFMWNAAPRTRTSLKTTQAFWPYRMRLSFELEATTTAEDLSAILRLSLPPNAYGKAFPHIIKRHGNRFILAGIDGQEIKTAPAPHTWPGLENWVLEIIGNKLTFKAGGAEVFHVDLPREFLDPLLIELALAAGSNIPRGTQVYVDKVKVDNLSIPRKSKGK